MNDARPEFLERLMAAVGDRYAIEREIGRGGTAIVYLALDRKHERPVALKVLRPEITAALGSDRFLREIQISARLAHPNILPLHDSGEADGFLYYVMPFVGGESLRERLTRERELPVDEALRIAREVAGALSYAHRQGVVHRDIKPENILLEDGHAVVADFGLARSLFAATSVTGSTSGLAIGTPAYMSPEQWSADPDVDGRSDLYSLGCVVYEMLAGEPPFGGPTPQAVSARHRLDTPRSLRITRPGVPSGLEVLVGRLLMKSPADRYQSAEEVVRALERPGAPEPRSRNRALVAAGLLVAALLVSWWYQDRGVPLDPERYLILPFRHRGEVAPALVNGDVCEAEIYEALARWNDIRLVNSLIVRDALARRGGASTLSDGLAVAERLGAGRLLWGELWEVGDTTYVRGAVYDVSRRGTTLGEHTIRLQPGQVGTSFSELADSLVLGLGGSPPREGAAGTQSFAALRAYGEAHAAIARWDLVGATEKLREALRHDSRYPQANLRLAQVGQWQDFAPAEWRPYANAAFAGGWLSARDSAVGLALLDLAESRFPEACQRYRALLARDSLDFSAWYGLGECQTRDEVVLRSRDSPSGWAFRSSQWSGIAAYRRALELVPSVHVAYQGAALFRLEEALFTEPGWLRDGHALDADTVRFSSLPALVADTLAFVPWPAEEVMRGNPLTLPPTRDQAIARSRGILRDIGTTWIQAFPASIAALWTYALAAERVGDLQGKPTGVLNVPTAMEAARTLRSSMTTPDGRVAAGALEVRFLLKTGRFVAAAVLADSLLASPDADSLGSARFVASLAALRGRVHRAAFALERSAAVRIATGPGGARPDLPDPVKAAGLRLLAYASFGGPSDSLGEAAVRARSAVASYFAGDQRASAIAAVLARPVALAWPALDTLALEGDYLLDLQRALHRGDRAGAGLQLEAINAIRATQRPGDVAIDATLAEVHALLAFGDTTTAVGRLGRILDALPTLSSDLLDEVPQAAALVRAMALRADLAMLAGDSARAARWGSIVVTLWSGGEGDTPQIVARLRGFTRPD